ncbi:ubiquitin-like protein 4A [Fopius arisanus]|uniref:Ubiquitin-like protein 4A n=1 Tax=Fopius arisanus TaxID=64838 RepID=A0A9R1T373_9HYME|nr:PREDICTED: ubiquitin-like protein 4A [Fopius arisanus]
MKVLVKILQGKACVVEISPTATVLELKNRVRELLGVDVPQQKLLLTGKALADENPLSFYPGIKDGIKLNLVVKKSSQGPSDEPQVTKCGTVLLRESVTKILKHYYSESETESIVNELIKDLRNKVNSLSFDDLERLATALIQDQESIG